MDDRGVSVPLTYVLLAAVTVLLAAGLLTSASGLVTGQQDRAVRAELRVVGDHLAGDVAATSRLAGSVDAPGRVVADVSLPDRVAGSPYLVRVGAPTSPTEGVYVYPLTLSTTRPDASVTVYVRSATPIERGRYAGGDLRLTYDASAAHPTLEVSNVD